MLKEQYQKKIIVSILIRHRIYDFMYLVKVPFDLDHWTKVAEEQYPNGLPKPFSADSTQWIFHGHPAESDQSLQVAVARLLGYRWPAELDAKIELADDPFHNR